MSTHADQPLDRRARRKAQTRAKLVEAARTVFARQGIDATRINEITDEADVGFGSFYNHFDGKDAIVAAVIEELVHELGASIDAATSTLQDPAEVVAVAHRVLVQAASADPELGWLLVRLELSHGLGTAGLGAYARRDLERGRDAGRFAVGDVELALAASGGALLGVIRAALDGRLGDRAPEEHAAAVLRLLGVPADEAADVAQRPLPAISP
ncbi:MAG TPA: TetR/AcrR family transcriptional regulator [Baekduia sp.]|nr:TetR/AcrR family transcriptional regulator [Baekduia sp.]